MNNIITKSQWEEIISAVKLNAENTCQSKDVIYLGADQNSTKSRHYIYDNYDRYDIPGFDFVISKDSDKGRLTVYNGSEMAYAPIEFKEGLQIAQNFFNEYGGQMAEEIVCDYVMDGNPKIRLWSQEDCNL